MTALGESGRSAAPPLTGGRDPGPPFDGGVGAPSFRKPQSRTTLQRMFPLKLSFAYLLAAYLLFLFGPIHWPIEDYSRLTLYLVACGACFGGGYFYSAHLPARGEPFSHWRAIYVLGGLACLALLFPSSIIYTGRWPWQALDAWRDQKEAYSMLMEQLVTTGNQRGPIALLRGVAGPFVAATLPLGLLHWSEMSWRAKALVFTTIGSYLIFSVLRGTSRQMADVLLLGGAGMLIMHFRGRALGNAARPGSGRFWLLAALAGLSAFGLLSLMAARISDRMGGVADLCMVETGICVDFNAPSVAFLPQGLQYIVGALTAYLAQGYYGLHLALQKDFHTSWGLGHSSALMQLYSWAFGDVSLYERTFTFRLRENNWSDLYQWSTTLVWFANDVSFPGVLILLIPLGGVFALSWVDATVGGDDRAAVLFSLLLVQMFFFTSNSQLLQTLDGYVAILFWMLLWLIGRSRRRIFV